MTLKRWQVDNAMEPSLSVGDITSDIIGRGWLWVGAIQSAEPIRDMSELKAKFVDIYDAEGQCVVIAPRAHAEVIRELLEWAAEHYPYEVDDE